MKTILTPLLKRFVISDESLIDEPKGDITDNEVPFASTLSGTRKNEKKGRNSEHDSDRKIDSEHDSVKLLWIFCIGVRSKTGPWALRALKSLHVGMVHRESGDSLRRHSEKWVVREKRASYVFWYTTTYWVTVCREFPYITDQAAAAPRSDGKIQSLALFATSHRVFQTFHVFILIDPILQASFVTLFYKWILPIQ